MKVELPSYPVTKLLLNDSCPISSHYCGFLQLIYILTRVTNNTTSLNRSYIHIQNDSVFTGFGTIPKIADNKGTVLCLDIKRKN